MPARPQVEQTVRAREELQLASRSKSRLRSRICCLMLGSIIVRRRARRTPAPQARPTAPPPILSGLCASRVPGGATAHHAHECTLVSEARGGCDAASTRHVAPVLDAALQDERAVGRGGDTRTGVASPRSGR